VDKLDQYYNNIDAIMDSKNKMVSTIRIVGRICGWAAVALLLFTLLTGYGTTEFRLVTPLTFGVLNKAVAQRLHAYTEVPILVLLSIHIGIASWASRNEKESRSTS
jgi:cytochrome b subunit of formate dehydrogenase